MPGERVDGALLRRVRMLVGLLPRPPPSQVSGIALGTAHSTHTVGPDTIPESKQPAVSLLAARGERESFQLLMRPKDGHNAQDMPLSVTVRCTDAVTSATTEGKRLKTGVDITLRKVVCVHGTPDALVPFPTPQAQAQLRRGQTTVLWASVDVPRDLPPGVYYAEIVIETAAPSQDKSPNSSEDLGMGLEDCLKTTSGLIHRVLGADYDNTEMAARLRVMQNQLSRLRETHCQSPVPEVLGRVSFQIRVWEFTLPITPTLPLLMGVSDEVFEKRFGLSRGSPCWLNALDGYARWLLSYRVSPYFCRWGHGSDYMALLTYTNPWPLKHERGKCLLEDPRLAAFALPVAPEAISPAHLPEDPSTDSRSSMLQMLKHLPNFEKAYFYLWDEPVKKAQYEQIRDWAKEIHAEAPNARVITTYYCGLEDGPYPKGSFDALLAVPQQLRGATQLFCISQWALGGRKQACDAIRGRLQGSEEWWGYVCMGPGHPEPNFHLDMTGSQQRAVLWRAWDEATSGYLYWGANCYKEACSSSAPVDFREGLPPGDGVLMYPGESFGVGAQPIASIRLERALSGMQDYEVLHAHAERFGREATTRMLQRTGVYLQPNTYVHPANSERIDKLRSSLAADIVANSPTSW